MEEFLWRACRIIAGRRISGRWRSFLGLGTEVLSCAVVRSKAFNRRGRRERPESPRALGAAFFLCRQTDFFPGALRTISRRFVPPYDTVVLIRFADGSERLVI